MRKIVLIIAICITSSFYAQDFGIKAGVNYNTNGDATFSSTGNDVINGAEAKTGYHAGIWLKSDLIFGLYIRPELVYTQSKSEYLFKGATTDYNFKKLDVPVLLGKSFLGFANAFIGPSFQYIIEDDFDFSDVTTDDFDKFSVGMQMGFGVEFGNLGVDVRWERGLTGSEAKFVSNNTTVSIDNRTNQIIFGVSLKL